MSFIATIEGAQYTLENGYSGALQVILLVGATIDKESTTVDVLAEEVTDDGYYRTPITLGAPAHDAANDAVRFPNVDALFTNDSGLPWQADCAVLIADGDESWGDEVTAIASNVFTTGTHLRAANDKVFFTGDTATPGLTANQIYYVIASGLTSTGFRVSATLGGGSITVGSLGGTLNVHFANGTVLRYEYRPISGGSRLVTVPASGGTYKVPVAIGTKLEAVSV
jgi:hypothetical protein